MGLNMDSDATSIAEYILEVPHILELVSHMDGCHNDVPAARRYLPTVCWVLQERWALTVCWMVQEYRANLMQERLFTAVGHSRGPEDECVTEDAIQHIEFLLGPVLTLPSP